MKPLKLNMSSMQKIAGDAKSSTFKHKDGHQMVIVHSAVPALQRKQLMELPVAKEAEGGEIQKKQEKTKDQNSDYREKLRGLTEGANQEQSVSDQLAKGYDNIKKALTGQEYAKGGKAKPMPEIKPDKGYGKIIFVGAEGGKVEAHDEDPYPEKASEKEHKAWLERAKKRNDALHKVFMANHEKIMKMACGGEVKMYADSDEPVSKDDSAPTVEINTAPAPAMPQQQEPTTQMANTTVSTEVPPTPQTTNIMNPNGTTNAPQAVQLQQQAAREQQAIDTTKGQSAAAIEDAYNKQKAVLAQRDQQAYQELKSHTDDFKEYMKSNPIDPKHYTDNMSTGSKVGTAIGLLLGGFAPPGENGALNFLNKQIDRDIDSQKARADQQRTVWGAYKDLYGDSNVANNLAKASLNDIYTHKMQETAAKLGTPQAKQIADAFAASKAIENQKLLVDSVQDAAIGRAGGTHINGAAAPANGNMAPAKNSQPRNANAPKGEAKNNKGYDYSGDHILSEGANQRYQTSQYGPEYKNDQAEVQKQLEQAALADKAIDAINKHFPEMYANVKKPAFEAANSKDPTGSSQAAAKAANFIADTGSYIHKKGENFEDVPYIGRAVSGLAKTVTDTQSNREYDVHRDAMLSAMTAALVHSGMTPTDAHSTAIDFLPLEGDTPEMAKFKINSAKEKLKNVTTTNALERHNLVRKGKK